MDATFKFKLQKDGDFFLAHFLTFCVSQSICSGGKHIAMCEGHGGRVREQSKGRTDLEGIGPITACKLLPESLVSEPSS